MDMLDTTEPTPSNGLSSEPLIMDNKGRNPAACDACNQSHVKCERQPGADGCKKCLKRGIVCECKRLIRGNSVLPEEGSYVFMPSFNGEEARKAFKGRKQRRAQRGSTSSHRDMIAVEQPSESGVPGSSPADHLPGSVRNQPTLNDQTSSHAFVQADSTAASVPSDNNVCHCELHDRASLAAGSRENPGSCGTTNINVPHDQVNLATEFLDWYDENMSLFTEPGELHNFEGNPDATFNGITNFHDMNNEILNRVNLDIWNNGENGGFGAPPARYARYTQANPSARYYGDDGPRYMTAPHGQAHSTSGLHGNDGFYGTADMSNDGAENSDA